MDCQHPVGILPVRVFRRNRDTADSAHRLPQATVRRAGRELEFVRMACENYNIGNVYVITEIRKLDAK